jgi:beta-aspartyl-peptidase (threonine type)
MTIAIAIHGGAGTIRRQEMTPERDAATRAGLSAALEAGHAVLRAGGAALDAVVAAVLALEDHPLFNAGKGAVFTLEGTNELEAAIMDGATRNAGSVTGVRTVKNPVLLAKLVMETTPNVTLGFQAADALAASAGLECVGPEYYFTEARWQALLLEKARIASGAPDQDVPEERKHGTIGAVALDDQGRLAAATSTGGRTAKWSGRIGDTSVIGAGTWADERCAVSCTGHGEYFMRVAAAHDVAARMAYLGQGIEEACATVIQRTLADLGGTGGMIGLDAAGRVAMPINCEGMYRGMIDGSGTRMTAIYADE